MTVAGDEDVDPPPSQPLGEGPVGGDDGSAMSNGRLKDRRIAPTGYGEHGELLR